MMQIFISYRREDADFAVLLRDKIESWDHEVWLDIDDIPPGAYWPDEIDRGLRASEIVIGIMTPESLESRNVKNEWDWTLSNHKPLLLLKLRDCDVPHRYISVNYIDFANTQRGFDQLAHVLANPDKITKLITLQDPSPKVPRNRERMLQRVHYLWIEGVLENSLHGAALIELGKAYNPEAVERPWDIVLQHTHYADHAVPPGTSILTIFNKMDGALLILGDPGAGKTTTLLELARDLINEAERDSELPIPVVFNLSSWAKKRKPVAAWVVDELNAKYDIPLKLSQEWIDNDCLLLLLDGLDEVQLEYRDACAEAINQFRHERGLVNIVVCSRIKDYEALTTRLKLQGAIVLKSLSPEQIDRYLCSAGDALSGARRALETDETLRELVRTPLMLSIISLAYHGMPVEAMPVSASLEERRKHLFDAYVQRMFEHRANNYTPDQTKHWLSWLAQRLVQQSQTEFFIERMQPDWLSTRGQRWLFMGGVALIFSLIWAIAGMLFGIVIFKVGYGMLAGLTYGLISGLFAAQETKVEVVETLSWSWSKARRGLIYTTLGGVAGGVAGLFTGGVVLTRSMDLAGARLMGLAFGILVGVMSGLLFGLRLGLIGREVESEQHITPNQGVFRSARNALRFGLIGVVGVVIIGGIASMVAGIVFWLLIGSTTGLYFGTFAGLVIGLLLGIILGIFFGLAYGGRAVVQHVILRWLLKVAGCMPWNYARFLDYAAERIFLRKIGGGYIFVHRTLMDYFANGVGLTHRENRVKPTD